MNSPENNPIALIASAIRRERARAGLSLSALAAKAGLAKSTLSQLESAQGNPSVETLWAIASALGVPFSFLFEAQASESALVRLGEGEPVISECAEFSTTLLADCPPNSRRDLYRSELQKGASHESEAHPAGTVEHVIVIKGELQVGPLGAEEVLRVGDYFRYSGDIPHSYTALSAIAVFTVVMETPR